jgi:HEAT repeat protein
LTQGLGIALWAVAIMTILNATIVVLTLGVKALRSLRRSRTKARNRRLESLLNSFLAAGRVDNGLYRIDRRDAELLAILMVEYLSLLRGAEREHLVELAEEIGLVERYFAWLNARNRWRKARAAENPGYFGGPAAVAPLTRLLSHPDETVRAVAARALARIGTPEAAEALARTLDDPSELTRLRMAENLERLGSLATDPLLETLESGQPKAQILSVRILGNLRAAKAGPCLRRTMLPWASTDIRAQAALALGKIGNPEDVPALQAAAEDEEWPVRAQVANALGMIGDVRANPTLRWLMLDEEWWVRLNAGRALANMGLAGEKALAEILEGEDDFARSRAAATLQERGIVRRVVGELEDPGERGTGARIMVRAMVKAGAVRYLERLARTLPDGAGRAALVRTMDEARDL